MRAALSDRGAMLGSGLGVSQCAPLGAGRSSRGQRALRFDGTLKYVGLPAGVTAALNGAQWSIEGWVKVDDGGSARIILGPTGLLRGRCISANTWHGVGKIGFAEENVAVVPNTQFSFTVGRPLHMIYTYESGLIRVFVNGVIANGPQAYAFTGPCLGTYTFASSTSRLFLGDIDAMRIYTRALPPYEIAEHSRGIYSNNDGLVGRWDLDEPDGLIAYDKSGYGNHGTLVGAPQRVQVFRPDRLP